ncbi:hypothetical protein [Geoalkalibacter halelectricus]|uniref:hypothetical protein n=1 Tax=Geoalkalibacter halelectricus TaxID=2847045 RepID=UPI003D1FE3A1
MHKILGPLLFITLLAFSTHAFAHTALMSCFDEGDDTITCEGGFSDGSSAAGIEFLVKQNDEVILKTRLNEFSEVNFEKPEGDYQAVFNAGEGHVVTVDGKNIF